MNSDAFDWDHLPLTLEDFDRPMTGAQFCALLRSRGVSEAELREFILWARETGTPEDVTLH